VEKDIFIIYEGISMFWIFSRICFENGEICFFISNLSLLQDMAAPVFGFNRLFFAFISDCGEMG